MSKYVTAIAIFFVVGFLLKAVLPSTKRTPQEKDSNSYVVNYKIVTDEYFFDTKRSVVVMLEEELLREELERIAWEIKDGAKTQTERTFINYYLPGMDLDDVCWAYTHFVPEKQNPEIKVNYWTYKSEVN